MKTVILSLLLTAAAKADLIYLAKVQFGNKTFEDILTLDKKPSGNKRLSGTFTVPGVFTSTITVRADSAWRPHQALILNGQGQEGDKSFPFRISVKSQFDPTFFEGEIIVGEDDSTKGQIQLILLREETTNEPSP